MVQGSFGQNHQAFEHHPLWSGRKRKIPFVVESVFDCTGIQVLIVAFHPVVLPTCGNGSNAEDRVCKFHNLLV
jgi:hypothetical protein